MFHTKPFNQQTSIGQILKNARYRTGLSLKIVARHVNVNKKYLEALEKEDWEKLPGEVYAKSFLKKYADFLNLPAKEINKINFAEIPCFKHKEPTEDFIKKTKRADFISLPKVTRLIFLAFIILLLFVYLVWQINQILRPPKIIIFQPTIDLTTNQSTIILSGQTEPEVKLRLNNQDIFTDENNHFTQTINLQPGLNVIKIEGWKKYSKKQVVERKIIYEVNNK